MKNKSLVRRVLFIYLAMVSCFLVLLFFLFFSIFETEAIAGETVSLNRYASLMEDSVRSLAASGKIEGLVKYASMESRALDVRITFINPDGDVLADSEENPAFMENHSGRPEVKSAMNGKNLSVVRYSNTLKKNMIYYAFRIKTEEKVLGVLRLAAPERAASAIASGLVFKYIAVSGFLVAASIFGFLVIHFGFKREIKRFAFISNRVSEGIFDISFSKDESYEINDLSRSFRQMISKIKTLIADLVFEKEEIEAIVSQIEEGIAVIDKSGRIVRANKSFQKIFDAQAVTGKHYWEVIRENEIVARLSSGEVSGSMAVEFELGEKILLCSIDYLSARSEHVLIFYDLTALRVMQAVKRDLVTNVSHELRTPLTSIRGYVETLLEMEKNGDKKRYLTIILKNAERLSNIVKDLLLLSELENGKSREPFEAVELKELVSRILPLFEEKIEAKGLRFSFEAPDSACVISGDSFELEQVFINLLDNALKYTNSGDVSVKIEKGTSFLSVTVRDTGIGIPEKDIPRIFERFYVVDKSRSRSHGGTGLGLSIVKHIMTMHSADIAVESRLDSGTTFVLRFPVKRE